MLDVLIAAISLPILAATSGACSAPEIASARASDVGDNGNLTTYDVAITVKNTGARDGDEVAQVYFRPVKGGEGQASQTLCAFTRIPVAAGKTSEVKLEIPVERFRRWDSAKKAYVVDPGSYELQIGAASDDICQRCTVTVSGS